MKFLVTWRGERQGEKPEMKVEEWEAGNFGEVADKFIAKHKGEVGVPVNPVTEKSNLPNVVLIKNSSGRALVVIIDVTPPVAATPPGVRKGGSS